MNSSKLAASAVLNLLDTDPPVWAQCAFALDQDGTQVLHNSNFAVAWSLSGAIRRVQINQESKDTLHTDLLCYAKNRGFKSLDDWESQPNRSFDEIKDALNWVITSNFAR